ERNSSTFIRGSPSKVWYESPSDSPATVTCGIHDVARYPKAPLQVETTKALALAEPWRIAGYHTAFRSVKQSLAQSRSVLVWVSSKRKVWVSSKRKLSVC